MQLTSGAAQPPKRRARAGFTLVEMLVVMVLLTIVGGSLMGLLAKQQRFYQGTADLGDLRSQLRQAEAVMSSDLRGISSVGKDITTMTDSSIDFWYTIGSSISCATPGGGQTFLAPPATLTNKTLTTWIQTPAAGDDVYVFDEGTSASTSLDDRWRGYQIASVDSSTSACPASPYGDATKYSYTVQVVDNPTSANILAGAAMRFVRPAHYSLYRSAGDSLWYLGYTCPNCATGGTILPIAGPFMPYTEPSTPDTSGIRITYFDSTGTATTNQQAVSRISIVLRGQTRGYLNVTGLKRGVYMDSVRMDIAIRNRS